MAGFNRSVVARATGMLCLLGISLGLGTVIIYHLLRHIFRRKPKLPENDAENANSSPLLESEQNLSQHGEIAVNKKLSEPSNSVASLAESGLECNSNPDLDFNDDLYLSVHSEDSVGSACECPRLEEDSVVSAVLLRRRKFGVYREREKGLGDISGDSCINSEIYSVDLKPEASSCNDHALSTKHSHSISLSGLQQNSLLESLNTNAQLDSTACGMPSTSLGQSSGVTGSFARIENEDYSPGLQRMMLQSFAYQTFDHSTPEDYPPVSFLPRHSCASWMLSPSDFTPDFDAPGKSASSHDCTREFPVASRSCASIDLGEMSSISNFVSAFAESGKFDCNAVTSMDEIQAELSNIQVEVKEITDKVDKLQSQGLAQYKLCQIDLSLDEDLEFATSPRQNILRDVHQVPCIEADLSHRNSEYMWDYDFDVEVSDGLVYSRTDLETKEENIGQLDSFVQYRTRKHARDSFRRISQALSQSVDISPLNRSDSVFGCVTPLLDDELEQKSCSLYDVNRRLSGQFVI